jgi:hypothetical protein
LGRAREIAAMRLDLPGAGEPDQPDVGDDLELEHDLELVAGLAEQREAGALRLLQAQRGVAEGQPRSPSATTKLR